MTQSANSPRTPKQQRIDAKLHTILQIANLDREPDMDERDEFEHTLKEIASIKKRTICDIVSKQKRDPQNYVADHNPTRKLRKELMNDLLMFCRDVVELIDTNIMPKIQSSHGRVFFLKIKGDFIRYSAEYLKKNESQYAEALEEGLKTYGTAYEIANAELPCESLVRLNLILNFSVFYYTVARNPAKACEVVTETLDKLDSEMDSMMEEVFKYIQPTRCLLKNNLMLWSSEMEDSKSIAENYTC